MLFTGDYVMMIIRHFYIHTYSYNLQQYNQTLCGVLLQYFSLLSVFLLSCLGNLMIRNMIMCNVILW